jgi:hypothetical protein
MGLRIHVSLDEDPPIDLPDSNDNFTFWLLCFYTLAIFALFLLLQFLRKRYLPLKAKSVNKMCVSLFCSLFHVWGLFIANEQSLEAKKISIEHCTLWNFWFPYFIGLNSWFIFMDERILYYILLTKEWSFQNKYIPYIKIILVIIVGTPIFVICILNEIFPHTFVDPTTNSCTSSVVIKLCILAWVLEEILIMYVLIRVLKNCMLLNHFNDYQYIRDALFIGFFLLLGFIYISFSGLENTSDGRTLQECFLVILYLFCFLRILGYDIWKALTNDRKYLYEYQNNLDPDYILIKVENFSSILNNPKLLRDFLAYIRKSHVFSFNVSKHRNDESIMLYNANDYLFFISRLDSVYGGDTESLKLFFKKNVLNYTEEKEKENNNNNGKEEEEKIEKKEEKKEDEIKKIYLNEPTIESVKTFFEKRENDDASELKMNIKLDAYNILGKAYFDTYVSNRLGDFINEIASHANLNIEKIKSEEMIEMQIVKNE